MCLCRTGAALIFQALSTKHPLLTCNLNIEMNQRITELVVKEAVQADTS